MKTFFFWEKDNIYKIFSVLDKIKWKYKEVFFEIHPNNDFFSNKWWAKLVIEKAQDVWVKINFIISSSKQEWILKAFNLNYIWKKEPFYKKIQDLFMDFVLLLRSNSLNSKYSSIFRFIILFSEISLLIFGVYFVYNLVVPKTEIYIQPSVKIKHLIQKFYVWNKITGDSKLPLLKYYTGEFTKVISVKLPVKDIKFLAKPSKWLVEFYNYSNVWYSLKAHTQLITQDGLIYRLSNWVYVPPAKSPNNPWTAKVKVVADTKDVNWQLIWSRWNISKWTILYVKNLYVSRGKKKLIAKAVEDFEWGEINYKWQVSLDDIQNVKNYLHQLLYKNIKSSIFEYTQNKFPNYLPLVYSWTYEISNVKYFINWKPGDKLAYLPWQLQANIKFFYLKKDDIKDSFKKYLVNHIVSMSDFLGWNNDSLEILSFKKIFPHMWEVTINFDALLWYDFNKDYNNIKHQIINQIVWLPISEAKKIILSYPVVAAVKIKTTNNLNKVSSLKSRIYIYVVK